MYHKFKKIDVKNRTYYFLGYMINIKSLDVNKTKVYENSYKTVPIYYTGYVTYRDLEYIKIDTINL